MTGIELYTHVSYDLSRRLTLEYSSSFGTASRLFGRTIRRHIFAIYGMVRVADEIVDTYEGHDKAVLLTAFHQDVMAGLVSGYSTNPIVHAFCNTARTFEITAELIDPFFASMATDLTATTFTQAEYDAYIYGSAEVIGLMCLKVFCASNAKQYDDLAAGARALGRAYQKVNFLRDFAADYEERGRVYFPDVTVDSWNDEQKRSIEQDISRDMAAARTSIKHLPASASTSVYLSYRYYEKLLALLTNMSAEEVRSTRAHVPTSTKLLFLLTSPIGARLS